MGDSRKMGEIYLTVKEPAEVKGCTERYIQSLIQKGKLCADCIREKGGGNSGTHYRIPLSGLEEKLQRNLKMKTTPAQNEKYITGILRNKQKEKEAASYGGRNERKRNRRRGMITAICPGYKRRTCL